MTDYAKVLEFIKLEQEFQRRSLEAAKNSPFPFIVNVFEPSPATDYSWQPLLFAPAPLPEKKE